MNRRDFIRYSSLASATFMIPSFLKAAANFQQKASREGKVMVIIQFSGGNDGLNTVIPYRNDVYYKLRPKLGISRQEAIPLSDSLGLNPEMTGIKDLYDDGFVSIVNSVGYPNPNRSHFRSMDIWQTASGSNQYLSSGWLGRMLDAQCPDHCLAPYHAIETSDTLSLALKGEKVQGLAISNPAQFYKNTHEPFFYAIAQQPIPEEKDHPNLHYLHKTLVQTTESAEYIHEKSRIYRSKQEYPASKLSKQLKMIAELIISGSETKVYYASLSGFDTHVSQKGPQGRLLKQYSEAVAAFVADLKENDRFKDVAILTFSEFGRRVKQNASGGTDHGTANNVFMISGDLKEPGLYNGAPNLVDLDNGDLEYEVDFRRVYSSLLNEWLGVDSRKVIGEGFSPMGIF